MIKALLVFAIIGFMGWMMGNCQVTDTKEKDSEEEDSA